MAAMNHGIAEEEQTQKQALWWNSWDSTVHYSPAWLPKTPSQNPYACLYQLEIHHFNGNIPHEQTSSRFNNI